MDNKQYLDIHTKAFKRLLIKEVLVHGTLTYEHIIRIYDLATGSADKVMIKRESKLFIK